MTQDKIGFSIR